MNGWQDLNALIVFALPITVVGLMYYAIRRNGRVQQVALRSYDQNRVMQEEMMERQRRILELTEENVEVQHEIRGLLDRIANALERRV